MRKWLAIALALGAVFLVGSSSWSAEKMEVKGVIADWGKLKAGLPANAFLQVVKLEDNLQGNTDAEGFSAFDSEFPNILVRADGSFRVDLKNVPNGKYFIALQRAIPKEMSGESMTAAIPILITKEGHPLVIEVPGTFPLNAGRVDVAVRAPKAPAASKKK